MELHIQKLIGGTPSAGHDATRQRHIAGHCLEHLARGGDRAEWYTTYFDFGV
jgi:hypothetical protein